MDLMGNESRHQTNQLPQVYPGLDARQVNLPLVSSPIRRMRCIFIEGVSHVYAMCRDRWSKRGPP